MVPNWVQVFSGLPEQCPAGCPTGSPCESSSAACQSHHYHSAPEGRGVKCYSNRSKQSICFGIFSVVDCYTAEMRSHCSNFPLGLGTFERNSSFPSREPGSKFSSGDIILKYRNSGVGANSIFHF